MPEFDKPTYHIDYTHSLNRATIESRMPGVEQNILVTSAESPKAPPIRAKGVLSPDQNTYTVTITTDAGTQTHQVPDDLLSTILRKYRR